MPGLWAFAAHSPQWPSLPLSCWGRGQARETDLCPPGWGLIGDLRALWWDRLPARQMRTVGGAGVSPGNEGGVSWLQMGARGKRKRKRGRGKESWTWGARGCCLR